MNAGVALKRGACLIARFAGDDFTGRAKFGPDQPTNDPEAANLYFKAEALIANDDPPSLHEAARLLSSAVERDPRFALALSELASVHVLLGVYFEDPRLHMPEAKRLREKFSQVSTLAEVQAIAQENISQTATVGKAASFPHLREANSLAYSQ